LIGQPVQLLLFYAVAAVANAWRDFYDNPAFHSLGTGLLQ
jgi:hypothetical protein